MKHITDGLVELIRPKRCSDHYTNLSQEDKNGILREIVSHLSEVEDSMLHDILWNNLPPAPNGNQKLSELQHKLAGANLHKTNRALVPLQVSGDSVLTVFKALVNDGDPKSVEVAKAAYFDLCLRGREEEIPDEVMYSYVRKIIPPVGAPNFREVAEKMISIIVENS